MILDKQTYKHGFAVKMLTVRILIGVGFLTMEKKFVFDVKLIVKPESEVPKSKVQSPKVKTKVHVLTLKSKCYSRSVLIVRMSLDDPPTQQASKVKSMR